MWFIAGWGLYSNPLEFDVMDVSVVSSEEFEQMRAASAPQPAEPQVDAPEVVVPEPPETEEAAMPEPVAEDPPPQPEPPPPAEAAEPDPPPALPEPEQPPADVADVAPPAPSVPQIVEDETLTVSDRPVPRPADRVADEVAPPPEPDDNIAEEATAAAAPAEEPAEIVEEEQQETVEEEAATQIVTEADEPAASAPLASIRPQTRPNRPTPPPETESTTTTASSDNVEDPAVNEEAVDDAVAAALAAASDAGVPETSVPQGPPMTGAEREGLRLAVQDCWNLDVGSEAARVVVTVGFDLSRQGMVEGEVRMVSANGGPDEAVRAAFGAAQRAVMRCQNSGGRSGYDLPEEKYGQWQSVEITFDPSNRSF
ncbi:hypothetical protein [Pelagovum pacificum]|uniref:hypothetical protein n=1 Tax=Pelagovum pacificum TaxID=2588711 RepID=UPI001E407129|nr:hypothetical protein [Pelagovum pacificum]